MTTGEERLMEEMAEFFRMYQEKHKGECWSCMSYANLMLEHYRQHKSEQRGEK